MSSDYHKYVTKDAGFKRLFSQVLIDEPTVPETINILRSICEKYQVHHGVQISDDALISAATLAHRYLTSRKLPDSAIDLIDEACARYGLTSFLSLSILLISAPQALTSRQTPSQRPPLSLSVVNPSLKRWSRHSNVKGNKPRQVGSPLLGRPSSILRISYDSCSCRIKTEAEALLHLSKSAR